MVVAGPGPMREHLDFPDENALQTYQMDIAEKLASAGWLLWGVNRQRRVGTDRRGSVRLTQERRQG
jgi:hypothetical protein